MKWPREAAEIASKETGKFGAGKWEEILDHRWTRILTEANEVNEGST
jgi:hypothetical protein